MKPNQFRSHNQWKTRQLFADHIILNSLHLQVDPNTCLYWLDERLIDGDKRPVLKELFLELEDPSGYKLASKYLGGWDHLQTLLGVKWFAKCWNKWQEELFYKLKSKALDKIFEIANSDQSQALAAAKYIAGREWEAPEGNKRGRPSKAEIKGELAKEVQKLTQSEEDYNRMVGNIIQFKKGK